MLNSIICRWRIIDYQHPPNIENLYVIGTKMISPITFRAGICHYDEESKICTPQPLKGEVTIKLSEETTGFYEFVWKATERTVVNSDPIELILIPDETKWIHVKSCKSGRVFCLLFSSGEKYFFWMQEKHNCEGNLGELSSKDQQLFNAIDKILRFDRDESEEGQKHSEDVLMEDVSSEPTQDQNQNP